MKRFLGWLKRFFECHHGATFRFPYGDGTIACCCQECGASWEEIDDRDWDDSNVELPPNFPTSEEVFKRMRERDVANMN